ncbi:uncharacterized protein ARMOST_06801 [Armillaria ostoyae]|uniref:F-box domain-containing protein n=1 Tax=Armillaria ostoyae TaxID=47428 RepID=A0A284R3Z9_ARMOS|nr:uncharacterized protein ARMOST_06801 [Armillaria ostoyae]
MSSSGSTGEPPQLPQELLNAIIDCLSDDIPSLHACSLVCRAWTEHAQEHIFHEQHFCTPKGPRGDLHKFRDLLRMSPHLGAFVKVIKLDDFPDGWKHRVHPWRHHEMETASPEVFPLLTTLKSFSFQLMYHDVWDQVVGMSVADAYKSTLRTAFLTDVRLSWLTFDLYSNFLHLLSNLVAVREINLSAITIKSFDDVTSATERDDRGCLRLISVHLNLNASLLQHLTQWLLSDKSCFDIGQIRRLTVLSTRKLGTKAATLPSLGPLESILKRIEAGAVIHLGLENALSSPLSSFASLRNLKTIKLFTCTFIGPSEWTSFFAQDVIEGKLYGVEEFTVHLEVFHEEEGLYGHDEDWLALDSISGIGCHVRVRFVFFAVLDQLWDEVLSRFTNEIRAALPNLHCKNLLHLNFQAFNKTEGNDRC